jgi:hypothetical protein
VIGETASRHNNSVRKPDELAMTVDQLTWYSRFQRASSILDFREHQVWKIVRPMREQPSNYEMQTVTAAVVIIVRIQKHFIYRPAHLLLPYVLPSKIKTAAVHTQRTEASKLVGRALENA